MSYASLIGDVDKEHNKEIVQERVPISAYGEATQGDIRLHIHPPVDIGPATHNAFNVRVAFYDEKEGGKPTSNFFCAQHVTVGQYVKMGVGRK